jgi:hypothetical protein
VFANETSTKAYRSRLFPTLSDAGIGMNFLWLPVNSYPLDIHHMGE